VFDEEEDIGTAGPEAAENGPKESVARVEGRPRALAFEHGDLLAEGKDFRRCIRS